MKDTTADTLAQSGSLLVLAWALVVAISACGGETSVDLTEPPKPRSSATATSAPATPTRTDAMPSRTEAQANTPTAPAPTATQRDTATASPSDIPTPSRTATQLPIRTATFTSLPTATFTAQSTATSTSTQQATATRTHTADPTATVTLTAEPTATRTRTATPTETRTPPLTATSTTIPTPTAIPSAPTASQSPTETLIPTPTDTPSQFDTPTPGGGGAECGNGFLEPGESYDDPVLGLVGDPEGEECAADAVVAACTPSAPMATFEVNFIGAIGTIPTSATMLIGYRSDLLSIPGSGASRDVRGRVRAESSPFVFTPNDLDYALRAIVVRTTPMENGRQLTIDFDTCGSSVATAGDLACTIEGCSGAGGPIDGCACEIFDPAAL